MDNPLIDGHKLNRNGHTAVTWLFGPVDLLIVHVTNRHNTNDSEEVVTSLIWTELTYQGILLP